MARHPCNDYPLISARNPECFPIFSPNSARLAGLTWCSFARLTELARTGEHLGGLATNPR